MPFIVIDNYDSFTYNLVHFLGELGTRLTVYRNDKLTVSEVVEMDPDGIILSPGPCTPNEAGICVELIRRTSATIPTFGVCLGHQAIGQAYGGEIVRAPTLMHGKLSEIRHTGRGVLRGINRPFMATRYHSLTIRPETCPKELEVIATTDDGVIMGIMHKSHPVHGVQFHPESIASEYGHHMLGNFLAIASEWNARNRPGRSAA